MQPTEDYASAKQTTHAKLRDGAVLISLGVEN